MSQIRERIIHAATGVPYLDGALINETVLAAAAEALRIFDQRLQSKFTPALNTGTAMEMVILVGESLSALLSEIESGPRQEQNEDKAFARPDQPQLSRLRI